MNAPMTAATVTPAFGHNNAPRWIVTLDPDAAEIMGETKLRYVYDSEAGANHLAATLQDNLNDAWEDAQ